MAMALEGGGFCRPNCTAVVAGEVCGYRLGGMLRRSRVAQHRDELHLDAKALLGRLHEPTAGPGKAQTSGSIDSQPKA